MNETSAPTTDARRTVESLVCDLPGGRPGEMSFETPWEIRAFALAVTAHTAGEYDWQQFQGALIDSISDWEANNPTPDGDAFSYYEHWVTALEGVLAQSGSLDQTALDKRTADALAAPPNRNHHKAILEPVAVAPALVVSQR